MGYEETPEEQFKRVLAVSRDGYAGVNAAGNIVDRRLPGNEKALPIARNTLLGTPKPRRVPATDADDPLKIELRGKPMKFTLAQVKAGQIGRNESCPCGSGKKFKRCCLKSQ